VLLKYKHYVLKYLDIIMIITEAVHKLFDLHIYFYCGLHVIIVNLIITVAVHKLVDLHLITAIAFQSRISFSCVLFMHNYV